MTDTNKLKELAEKLAPAYQQPWESHRHSASAVTVGAVGEDGEYSDFIDVRISDYSAFDEHDDELGQWIAAANPQAILGLIDEVERLEEELSQCASAPPGTYYMDPPDGGNVSIPEQIRRMAKDAARYRWLRERDLETISRGGVFAGMTPENIVLNLEDLDAEIDAAIEGATQ
ncbi:TPA: hypothetical protein SL665_001647 [Pseudomonas aeruginosa]|uniref:hypothetical protein n=1 Tax=Pseudomonas aeruginosa TaxID=287 RepID=UPI0003F4E48A|nr:hypothetical protein [Pseudomonas aeruginosa]ALY46389.1 hypothetical protein HW08_03165 [Pseudomonas aeruginosa]EMB9966804.1 hypothetical protein [Pseudomonas aeruginosa]MBG4989672.1 hypothetical protein [Pseudomonas aeruginosa]MBG5085826.1 hypothetical protein [Pseudomonas aeruginosa]MBG6396792.1 hypothetical protein [Pseudomonas aeruginosa]